eukprot:gene1495-4653_t
MSNTLANQNTEECALLMQVLSLSVGTNDTQHICQCLETATFMIQSNPCADESFGNGGFYAYALGLCDRFKSDSIYRKVYKLLQFTEQLDAKSLNQLAQEVMAISLFDHNQTSRCAHEAFTKQLCQSEVRRAQYGEIYMQLLLERVLLIRVDDNMCGWKEWAKYLELIVNIVNVPSTNSLLQAKVLPLLQAIFQENLLQRRNLDSYIHMQIVQLIMAACQNNVMMQQHFTKKMLMDVTTHFNHVLEKGNEIQIETLIQCMNILTLHHLCILTLPPKKESSLNAWSPTGQDELEQALHRLLESGLMERNHPQFHNIEERILQCHDKYSTSSFLPRHFPTSRTFSSRKSLSVIQSMFKKPSYSKETNLEHKRSDKFLFDRASNANAVETCTCSTKIGGKRHRIPSNQLHKRQSSTKFTSLSKHPLFYAVHKNRNISTSCPTL